MRMTRRRMPWLLTLAALAGAAPTFLALLSRRVRLPSELGGLVFVWEWGLAAAVALMLAVVGVLTCPWRRTTTLAVLSGWSSFVAAASVLPLTVYTRAHWSQHSPDEVVGIFTAGGIVRDMDFQLMLLGSSMLVGLATVFVAHRRARTLALRPRPRRAHESDRARPPPGC